MKDISPRNQSFLEKENITFLGTSTLSSEEAARQDCKSVIQLKTSGTLYTYTFDSGIPKEKLEKKQSKKSQKENSAELKKTEKSPENTSDSLCPAIFHGLFCKSC